MKKYILAVLIVLIAFVAIAEGIYIYTDGVEVAQQNNLIQVEGKSLEKLATPTEESSAEDTYVNGTFPGIIKTMSKDKDGNISIGVDFVQTFGGREAFLAAAEDFDKGKNKASDWSAFKNIYPAYSQLATAVRGMTEEQFDTFFYDVYNVELRKNGGTVPGGILSAFPNGYIYMRNENSKVRVFPLDKKVTHASITNGSELFSVQDMYIAFAKTNPIDTFPYALNTIGFTLANGAITKVVIFYRP